MDFLRKLNYLMDREGLNKSTLSKSCGIPYTTIDGWYKKGYEGLKLTTLRKLSNFFGTSLDYWASENNLFDVQPDQLTESTFTKFKELKPEYQEYILKQIELLFELQQTEAKKAQKNNPSEDEYYKSNLFSGVPKTPKELEEKYPPVNIDVSKDAG